MTSSPRLLELSAKLGPPRVIHEGSGSSPYLSRWYLKNPPRMPDGSRAWDDFGDMRAGHFWKSGVGVYLHRFHRSDQDRELHNHPWKWSASLILAGGYIEERRSGDATEKRILLPGDINRIGHGDFHRVDLIDVDCWTLFIAGPKASSWGFWSQEIAKTAFKPWRQFLDEKRKAA